MQEQGAKPFENHLNDDVETLNREIKFLEENNEVPEGYDPIWFRKKNESIKLLRHLRMLFEKHKGNYLVHRLAYNNKNRGNTSKTGYELNFHGRWYDISNLYRDRLISEQNLVVSGEEGRLEIDRLLDGKPTRDKRINLIPPSYE